MKFPRNARLLRSPFEVAPFAAVLFLLMIFLMLGALVPTPGIPLQLPVGGDLPGIGKPSIAVAVDANGRYFFENQLVSEIELQSRLTTAEKFSRTPLTLVIHADKTVTEEQLIHLTLLAEKSGITNALLATLPDPVKTPARQ